MIEYHSSVCQRLLSVLVCWCEHGLGALQCLCQRLHKCCFDKKVSWCTKQSRSARDSLFCFDKNASWCLVLWALLLNWIHSKIISATTFRMIGLAKIAIIEFLSLDWIYRSIRIMTVSTWSATGEGACPPDDVSITGGSSFYITAGSGIRPKQLPV